MGQDPFEGTRFQCLLFDLDDTLYPESCGLASACRNNIQEYMVERLGLPADMVPDLCAELYSKYGTTMAGLQAIGHHLDFEDWHSFVHGRLPYDAALAPDPELRRLLLALPHRKWVFTNADAKHAARVLQLLGLHDCFEGVIAFESVNPVHDSPARPTAPCIPEHSPATSSASTPASSACPSPTAAARSLRRESSLETLRAALAASKAGRRGVTKSLSGLQAALEDGPPCIVCKPQPQAYVRALALAGAEPGSTLYFDDSLRNISGGKAAGLATVLVGKRERSEGADLAIQDIHELPQAAPSLWSPAIPGPNQAERPLDLEESRSSCVLEGIRA